LKDNRNEKDVKDDIAELLYKSIDNMKTNNGLYLMILCNVTILVCMTTGVTWLLVLIALIIYWLYIAIEIVMYFYNKKQLKKLYSELNEKIGEGKATYATPKVFKNVFKTDVVFMILTSLVAMYLYY